MKRYAVTTEDGRVFDVWAENERQAVGKVVKMTYGRARAESVRRCA